MKTLVAALVLALLAIPVNASDTKSDLYSIPVTTIEGKKSDLSAYRGKVLLVVNTASQCGYTPQYEGLQKLYKKYKDRGLVVLGFPSNDFGGQEPGSDREIRYFCQSNYAVDFPMFSKGAVGGDAVQSIYAWLLRNASSHEPVDWNFEKFLLSRKGRVISRFKSSVSPDSATLSEKIEAALSATF